MRQRHNSSFMMFLLRIILSILCLAQSREGTTVYKKFSQSELKWESSNSSEVLPTANLGTSTKIVCRQSLLYIHHVLIAILSVLVPPRLSSS